MIRRTQKDIAAMADGRIVAHAITPHTPRMANPDSAPEFLKGVMAGSLEMGETIRAQEPENLSPLYIEGNRVNGLDQTKSL